MDSKALCEPEVHIIGEVVGGSGYSTDNAFCLFEVKHGQDWVCVGGDEQGQTQCDYPQVRETQCLLLPFCNGSRNAWCVCVCVCLVLCRVIAA
jgi:hypothetical protein